MRVDEKQLDGPDLERHEQQQESLLAETKEAALPELATDEAVDLAYGHGRNPALLDAVRMILADKQVSVGLLGLPQREQIALEAIQAAVTGRSTNIDQFLYASDRRSLLEQALAILQPHLTSRDAAYLADMKDQFGHLTKRVGELREELMHLEDGQDELMAVAKFPQEIGAAGDKDDDDDEDDDDKAKPATSTLSTGPARAEPSKVPTTLTGPDVKVERLPTTLTGKGDDPPAEPTPATSLGDVAEIEAAAKQPWWRRPVG